MTPSIVRKCTFFQSKLVSLLQGTKSLTQLTNSLMLKKLSENQDDVSCNVKMDKGKQADATNATFELTRFFNLIFNK